jgi:hypothetical protein
LASYKDALYLYQTWKNIRDPAALVRWASRNAYQKILKQLLVGMPVQKVTSLFLETIAEAQLESVIEFVNGNYHPQKFVN